MEDFNGNTSNMHIADPKIRKENFQLIYFGIRAKQIDMTTN